MRRRRLTCFLVLAAAACGRPAAERGAAPADSAGVGADPAPLWTLAGLEVQPRMERLRARGPGALGYTPGTTPWRPRPDTAADSMVIAPTPGAAVARTIAAAGWSDALGDAAWEQTVRVLNQDSTAVGVVLQWGLKDDAVTGRDLRVRLRREGAAWRVESVEERFHCSRSVTPEGLCA